MDIYILQVFVILLQYPVLNSFLFFIIIISTTISTTINTIINTTINTIIIFITVSVSVSIDRFDFLFGS